MFSSVNLEKSNSINFCIIADENLYFIILAGFPPTIAYGGTSFVTTAPAAIIAPFPMVTPEHIIAPNPIQTSS